MTNKPPQLKSGSPPQPAPTPLAIGRSSDLVQSIVIGPDNVLYAGMMYGGIFASTDGGASWIARNAGLTAFSVHSLVAAHGTPSEVYAGGDSGVFKSTDRASWITADEGLTDVQIYSLAIAPSIPTSLYTVAGLYAAGRAGVFASTNAATNWTPTALVPTPDVVAVDPTSAATVYVGTSMGVFKTTDGGAHWMSTSSGLPPAESGFPCGPNWVSALTIDPTSPTTLYACVFCEAIDIQSFSEVFKTTDGGRIGSRWMRTFMVARRPSPLTRSLRPPSIPHHRSAFERVCTPAPRGTRSAPHLVMSKRWSLIPP